MRTREFSSLVTRTKSPGSVTIMFRYVFGMFFVHIKSLNTIHIETIEKVFKIMYLISLGEHIKI